jgi:hypothetical protein
MVCENGMSVPFGAQLRTRVVTDEDTGAELDWHYYRDIYIFGLRVARWEFCLAPTR